MILILKNKVGSTRRVTWCCMRGRWQEAKGAVRHMLDRKAWCLLPPGFLVLQPPPRADAGSAVDLPQIWLQVCVKPPSICTKSFLPAYIKHPPASQLDKVIQSPFREESVRVSC